MYHTKCITKLSQKIESENSYRFVRNHNISALDIDMFDFSMFIDYKKDKTSSAMSC